MSDRTTPTRNAWIARAGAILAAGLFALGAAFTAHATEHQGTPALADGGAPITTDWNSTGS
ncbi:hypothetical protein ACWCPF_19195 [Streptomyces sp. NPDC001858]